MTTAHKPTFHPAVGRENQGGYRYATARQQFSSRDMPSQLDMKMRQKGQNTVAEIQSRDLVKELQQREAVYQRNIQKERDGQGLLTAPNATNLETIKQPTADQLRIEYNSKLLQSFDDSDDTDSDGDSDSDSDTQIDGNGTEEKQNSRHKHKRKHNHSHSHKHTKNGKKRRNRNHNESSADENEDEDEAEESSSSSMDSEDEEALLMAELAAIRKEKAIAKAKQEMEERKRVEREKQLQLQRMRVSNPLLLLNHGNNTKQAKSSTKSSHAGSFNVHRSWTEDTVFRNQAPEPTQKKRFINDTIRSDFHRKFMNRYIK